jgi:2-C-methyl-D-erythritol 4-phosphate cytidylyltransferase/2-C-methyl-D-erythritol 2,4-cyclodiphosphate synthase
MLGAGNSTRFGLPVKKQWLRIGLEPLWLVATKRLAAMHDFKEIIVVAPEPELFYMRQFGDFIFCPGGQTRQESLKAALAHVTSEHVMVSDIARACVPFEVISRLLKSADCADVIVPALKVTDTAFFQDDPINREEVRLIQTPQLSRTSVLQNALESAVQFTDDSSAIKADGGTAWYVEGDEKAHKLTFPRDITKLPCLAPPSLQTFTGNGFDVHAFGGKGPLKMGGVTIPSSLGFKAHSDGDVALHALTDALLGAACAGDIGEHFPDTDPLYKGADSGELLTKVLDFIKSVGFEPVHCDVTIIAQSPKIGPHKAAMQQRIASLLGVPPYLVNIKATTTETLGFIGRKEGVAVQATATLKLFDWTDV